MMTLPKQQRVGVRMKADDLRKLAAIVTEELLKPLEERVAREIDRRVEAYRRAVWVREEWCCNDMRTFATKFWNAPKPRNDDMWGISYQIRGHQVNYCPFCGAFVGRSGDSTKGEG